MAPRSRRFRQIDEPRVAALFIAAALALVLGAYGYGLTTTVKPAVADVEAAVALVAIGAAGLLYAWRAVAGGPGD